MKRGQPERIPWLLLGMGFIAGLVIGVAWTIHSARAQYIGDWGVTEQGIPELHPAKEMSDWMESLNRPSYDPDLMPNGVQSCCSLGDAYPIEIKEEAIPGYAKTEGYACVTDTRAIQIKLPNGSYKYRRRLDGNPCFHYTGVKLTREKDGNPTKTAWAFLKVGDPGENPYASPDSVKSDGPTAIQYIYCVVPLPPAI